jgi:hypothetical protein
MDICNMALSNLGCESIVSLESNSESAKLLLLRYDSCLKEVLREFPWSFARASTQLAILNEDYYGFGYAYQYPNNCVKVLKLWQYGDRNRPNSPATQFEVRVNNAGDSRIIVTNMALAYTDYTRFIDNPDVYDPEFITAFTYKLAAEIGNAKTVNAQLVGEMLQRYQLQINSAQRSNAVENYTETTYASRYNSAHSGTRQQW